MKRSPSRLKPVIGVVGKHDEKREYINQGQKYLNAVTAAGGLPVIIPPVTDRRLILEYAEQLDGVLLPGSSTDVDPAIFGSAPHPKLGRIYPERDTTDLELFRYSDQHDLPALGVCFGIQSLNVSRGGSLVQDIPAVVPSPLVHSLKTSEGGPARHPIRIEPGSLLAGLAGGDAADVNSYHHQSVDRLGARLKVTAVSPDGVIEAVEDTGGRFIVGVQWHPEEDWEQNPLSRALFAAFVERARDFRKSREKAGKQS
ncbi:MAG TPA: gamma-glutamyl-gamma-aminobutyrate hydrolase family protein [Terriglobia bacterium]|nr:gamma-glutamyl-gamma-aminobutyrate hydrolase family protein [Terriglobia bacterium]